MLAIALLAAATQFSPVVAEDKLVVLCDPKRFRFSVRARADVASVDRSYPVRRVIDADDLMAPLPGYTGNIEIRGPLIRYERCGPYTIRFEGDAYNTYIQGESGAMDSFVNMRVIWGNRTVYPVAGDAARLVECDRSLPRARPCPTGYAVRVDGWFDAAAQVTRFDEHTSSVDDSGTDEQRRLTVQHYTTPSPSLAQFWPSQD